MDDLSRNVGLRKARLAWYIAIDLIKDGDMDGALTELKLLLDGLERSYDDVGRDHNTQYFLKVKSEAIAYTLAQLGRREMLKDMKELQDCQMKELILIIHILRPAYRHCQMKLQNKAKTKL